MEKLEAEAFKLIRERKKTMKNYDWDDIAHMVNQECGTNVEGDQIREFVQRGVVPFGGWLVDVLEFVMDIPRRHPKTKISFKGGGSEA